MLQIILSFHTFFLFSISSSKPLVCLFSASFKQNLLSFIYVAHSSLPGTTILCLLKCLSQDSHPNPWVTALSRQLERNLGTHHNEPLYTQVCSQRLKELSERLVGFGETGGWAKCSSSQTVGSESQSEPDLSELGTQRKRRGSFVHLDSHVEETGQQSKRIRLDIADDESVIADEGGVKHLTPGGSESSAPAADSQSDVLPEHMKVNQLLSSYHRFNSIKEQNF